MSDSSQPEDAKKLKTIWDLIRWLIRHPANACCCIFLLVIGLLSLRLAGWTISSEKPYVVPAWDSFQQGTLKDTIKAGVANKKSYVIESVVMFARIDGSASFARGERTLHSRIVYTLRPLTDIVATNGSMFPELYRTTYGTHMRHWPGSEIEVIGSGGGKSDDDKDVEYTVQFSASKGETYTVVTGSDFDYKLPLKDN